MIKRIAAKAFAGLGYSIKKAENGLPDLESDKDFFNIYNRCKEYTMTSPERMYALYSAVKYVLSAGIPGDFVECGVWRGGSSMLMAELLHRYDDKNRKLYLYDTYEGMPPPTEADVSHDKVNADEQLSKASKSVSDSVWCYSSFDEVRNNMAKVGLPQDRIFMIKGKVEDTIPHQSPSEIALLRLDTDWYESTKHELIHLFPVLTTNGVLLIDDYGHWEGCRKAVDEYFADNNINILLNRIDYTGRIGIKTAI